MSAEGWIRQTLNGNTSYTYDAKVNTAEEAKTAGYTNVDSVSQSATLKGSTTLAGVEISNYSISLNGDGTVMTNGRFTAGDFITDAGSAIRNVQYPNVSGAYFDNGTIKMMGGAGDPFGIYEGLGMALGSSDSNAKYAIIPLLVVKGQGDDALKILNAEKGILNAELNYAPRVRMRGLEDPKSHNFLYSFDDAILSTTPIPKKNGYNIFQLEGSMNGKNGVYEIGKTKDGIIDHRFFRPNK